MTFKEFMLSINGKECIEYLDKLTLFIELHVAPELETYKAGLGMTKIVFMKMDKAKLYCKSEINFEWSKSNEAIEWMVKSVTKFKNKETYLMEFSAYHATMIDDPAVNKRLN